LLKRPPDAFLTMSSRDEVGELGADDELVQVRDVGGVMLAVVVLEGLGRDVRGQGVLGVG
jgi:hypothetical protein